MAAPKLTAASVATVPYRPCSARWSVVWHSRLKGFGVRITAAGARSYVVKYRLRGDHRTRLGTIGTLAKYTFGEAHEVARQALRDAEAGRDYFETIKRKRKQTLGEVWRYYVTEHLSDPDISERTRGDNGFLWKNHGEGEFDRKPLADITSESVRDWHRRVTRKSGPYVANRAHQALRASWNYARRYGRVPRELENPFVGVELNKEVPRQTILQPHQVPRFIAALNAVENDFARAYLQLLFHTGARRTELLRLEWRDVELLPARKGEPRHGSILLRHAKGGEPRRVELSHPAVAILESLPRTGKRYVFEGKGKSPVEPEDHWRRVREAAGLPDLRMHDLRRSVGSWLGAAGISSKMVGTVLGHKSDITSRHYIALGEAIGVKRQLAAMHAQLAEEFAKDKPRATVTSIEGARGATGKRIARP